jgi:hypothetical protein
MQPHPESSSEESSADWIRPDGTPNAEPRWGHKRGIQVGLHPLGGPRGLLRIYAPYLGHPADRLVNFVAVEPIVAGQTERGYSELEHSSLDGEDGKRMWSADSPSTAIRSTAIPSTAARGTTETIDGIERLQLFVMVEPFDNGADVYVRVTFRADRPHEIGLAAFRSERSAQLESCVLSATMGNFARLRRLQLADRIVTPADLWPEHDGDGFTEHARFPLSELGRTADGDAIVSAMPDEERPQDAHYAAGTAEHWKYFGARAMQIWRASGPTPELEARVNGRTRYWASSSPIPGGISYENFELVEPFMQGREFFFSVEPLPGR